jgi:heptaprenyl diphosphate synthase
VSAPSLAALVEQSDPLLEAAVRKGLDGVEALLLARTRSEDYPFVTETAAHLNSAGGKRFRPLVTLLSALAVDPTADVEALVVPAAVAIELTHLSTLYHDDVMDEAPLRRGAQSANARWGNTVAILTGDFLFAKASEITADLGTEATRILARTIAVLCQGQIRETVGPGPEEDAVEHHLRVLAEKTGSLIATSGHLGALLVGGTPEQVQALTSFGHAIGVAFQISDDLIDISSASAESGKTPGTDLREGIATLPALLALADRGTDPALHAALLAPVEEADVERVLAALRAHPACAQAMQVLQQWADRARAALGPLADTPAREALTGLADFVVQRTG